MSKVNKNKNCKRLIIFYNKFESDKASFICSSTEYKIFPNLYPKEYNEENLYELAKKLKLKPLKNKIEIINRYDNIKLSNVIELKDKKIIKDFFNKEEFYTQYLALIDLNQFNHVIEFKKSINNKISEDESYGIINCQSYGIEDVGEHVKGGNVLVKKGWEYYHTLPLLGYSLKHFEKINNINHHGFYDDTFWCDHCGLFDDRDDGYTCNYRIVNNKFFGINCGCFKDFCESDESLDFYKNNTENAMELNSAQSLKNNKKIEFCERFIGGMVDGRGGYWNGQKEGSGRCREGDPKSILKEYKSKFPNTDFIFSHDESGQFQTYFSIWKIL